MTAAHKIRVHERALAHLSRGLYRSPASAIRELVSNAWDANAKLVSIDTNHPNFFQLSIEDDGDGFGRDDFERLMAGGIGNSLKRTDKLELRWGRPTIGRLGIGMLGIAQICGSFSVTSRPRTGGGFRARVTLFDLAKSKMDESDSDLVHDARTTLEGEASEIPSKIVEVGTYEFEDFDENSVRYGTRLLADDVVPTFSLAFHDSVVGPDAKPVPLNWLTAVTSVLDSAPSLQTLGDYWRLLWELSASCPLTYLSDNAVPASVVTHMNAVLQSYNFQVQVDGRKLRKPVMLTTNEGGYTTNKIVRTELRVYGRPLVFEGYITVQEGRQIRPDELRGLLIRIKNVGIGYYDPSMLDFPDNQGPRSRWVTGEIYVSEGLEDALNIDRDSFNRFHPEFRALQQHVHGILRTKVFPEVYTKIQQRSVARQKKVAAVREDTLRAVVNGAEDRPVWIAPVERTKGTSTAYSTSRRHGKGVEVAIARADDLPTKKSSRQLAQSILAIFELSLNANDKASQREEFAELLFDLLKRW